MEDPAFNPIDPNKVPRNNPVPPADPIPAELTEPPMPAPPPKSKREGIKSVITTVLILLAAPIIALFLTSFIFQSYEVDGPSMETTLQNHDRLIVLKTARTWARITGHDYIPHRGDIVIFIKRGLLDAGQGRDKQLIKRVIGLPGDHVVVSDGVLTIYNKQHPEGFQPDKTLPYGNVITTTPGDVDLTVAPGEIFVCGDNRPNSLDSRSEVVGPVPAKDIVGKLAVRILPFSNAKKF